MRLTAVAVKAYRSPGRYADGNNLYLVVDARGAKRWLWRGVTAGKRCDLGLGSVRTVTLAQARAEALRLCIAADRGDDVRALRSRRQVPTFTAAALKVHAAHGQAFRNAKHREDWISSLTRYAFPLFGGRRVDQVTSADVLPALSALWTTKPETARRVKQRIRVVFDWAKASGYRTGDNPIDGLTRVLPRQARRQQHYEAMPYAAVPAFLGVVRDATWAAEPVRLALEWTILTGVRTSEALGAQWEEIDREAAVWTVPADRMKAKRAHRVPLAARCLELLTLAERYAEKEGGYLFPGRKAGQPLSNMAMAMLLRRLKRSETVHGFRSAFRDWASEQTHAPHAVMEAALAHLIPNKVEAAYARSDLFDSRRALMAEWAAFIGPKV